MTPCRTALVTGATGFIGQHLVRRLVAENVTTYCLLRAGSLTPEVERRLSGARFLSLHSDAADDWKRALDGAQAEAVFHLASPGVAFGIDSPEETIESNVRLMCRLLPAVRGWPLRNILHAGSFSEYGPSEEVLTEDSPLLPSSAYGASKAAAWLSGRSLALQLGLPLVALRLFHVYGPGESARRLIPYLYGRLSQRQPAPLTGGDQVRDVVFVSDVVEALWAATFLPPETQPAVFNVCTGKAVAIREIGATLARQMNVPERLLRWGEVPYRAGEPMRAVGDNRRFVQATGWQPRVNLADGIAHTLASRGWRAPVRLAG